MTIVISVENLSKFYQLGQIGGGRLYQDLNRWWARRRGQPDPYLKIGQEDTSATKGEAIWALKEVSFTVQQGEVLGIIGRNGAGKSTLLKILARVTAPTDGLVRLKGRVASLLEVGTGFHPDLTGRENVYLNGAILGMNRQEVERKFDEIVAFAELDQFIDTPVKRYSSGLYVRLAFAVAAHLEPEILLVDEVLAVGDVAFQKKCLGKMGDVAGEGRTVLFVSHNMGAVRSLCKDGVFLHEGRLKTKADIADTVAAYLNTIEVNGQASIFDRTDRSGQGTVRLTQMQLLDKDGGPMQSIHPGDKVNFVFDVDGTVPTLGCRFTIYNSLGQSIAAFRSDPKGLEDASDPERPCRFVCQVDHLYLIPGKYRINVMLKALGIVQDQIEGAYYFEVLEGNLDGRFIKQNTAVSTIFPHRWITPG